MTPLTRIQGYAHVAARYGLEEAIFLDAIVYWYRTNRADNRNFRDGRWWTYNSVAALCEVMPWWSAKQIRRIANSCREQGALLSGEYNEDRRDRSLWYTPNDELLVLYGLSETGNCICPNGQMHSPERADGLAHLGEPLPCNNHVSTTVPPYSPPTGDAAPADKPKPKRTRRQKSVPDHCPERFEQFWKFYPGGGSRLKAVAAWDALAPDDGLIDEMARALKRQKASPRWRDGVGIPDASTWLNQRRWTDKLPETPRARSPGDTWADDPEVIRP